MDLVDGHRHRRAHLKNVYGFVCLCGRCLREDGEEDESSSAVAELKRRENLKDVQGKAPPPGDTWYRVGREPYRDRFTSIIHANTFYSYRLGGNPLLQSVVPPLHSCNCHQRV